VTRHAEIRLDFANGVNAQDIEFNALSVASVTGDIHRM
jgi:hypothetical protein